MENLCNGGTKDFVELSETWSITVKPAQTTTSVRPAMLSLPKKIPIKLLLYKTTTCLTRLPTTFFDPQMKKSRSKTIPTKLYPAKECKKT